LAKCTANHFIFIDADGHAYQMDIDFLRNTIEEYSDNFEMKDFEKDIAHLFAYNFKMYKSLSNMKITDIACGESHTLFLNNK